MVTDKEYEEVKKLYTLMRMSNLSDLNALYNFQDTIILAEIFENRVRMMHQKFGYNPLIRSSASTLREAIQRHQSKSLHSYPTKADIIELMEKTLIKNLHHTFLGQSLDSWISYKYSNDEANL